MHRKRAYGILILKPTNLAISDEHRFHLRLLYYIDTHSLWIRNVLLANCIFELQYMYLFLSFFVNAQ